MENMVDILCKLHPEVDFESSVSLVDDGILDSFDIIAIVAGIADVYGINVPAEEIIPENFNSALRLFEMVERLMEE